MFLSDCVFIQQKSPTNILYFGEIIRRFLVPMPVKPNGQKFASFWGKIIEIGIKLKASPLFPPARL